MTPGQLKKRVAPLISYFQIRLLYALSAIGGDIVYRFGKRAPEMGLLVRLMGEIRAISGAREPSAASPDGPTNDAAGRRDREARYFEYSFFTYTLSFYLGYIFFFIILNSVARVKCELVIRRKRLCSEKKMEGGGCLQKKSSVFGFFMVFRGVFMLRRACLSCAVKNITFLSVLKLLLI